MTTTSEETAAGGLSAAGRFARMEAALERIESKLDGKADAIIVARLDERLSMIEDHGSKEARDALTIASEGRQRIIELEKSGVAGSAVAEAMRDIADARYKSLLWVVGIVTIAGVIFNALIIVAQIGGVFSGSA